MAEKKIPKGPRGPVDLPVDQSLLSKEDKAALRKEAQSAVLAERKQKARDAAFDAAVDAERRALVPEEQYVNIVIDGAPYVPFFMIDGEKFFTGYEYQVTRSQAAVLCEQMQRSWYHQNEIQGQSKFSSYRRPLDTTIGRAHAGTVTPGFAPGGAIHADL